MSKYAAPSRKHRLFPVILICLLLMAGIGICVLLRHCLWTGTSFVPRSATYLDLREKNLSEENYLRLRREMPGCEILWSVPLQGNAVPCDSQVVSVTSLSEQELRMLEYFPGLTTLDATGCTDYDELMAFRQQHPDCEVLYQVPIGGTHYPGNAVSIRLTDASPGELEAMLPYLPDVTEVHLAGQLPPPGETEALRETFPGIAFRWEVTAGNVTVSNTVTELDLSGQTLTFREAEEILSRLPALESADMTGCGLTEAEMLALAEAFPRCFFLWDVTFGDITVRTDAEEVDISGQSQESTARIEALLPCFPRLKRVIMSHCGLDDETMDALNRRYEDIRFIWSVKIKDVYLRTDATYFYPFKFYRSMVVNDEDLYPLRYCTDIQAIDIGHMTTVTNCEWAAFMPNLKYLVIVETAITDITPLSNLKNLVFLEIFTTKITDYSPLLGCTALEDLNLGKTYGDPTPITKMTWLKNVWWSGVEGTYGLPASNARQMLTEALPNTRLKFNLSNPNVGNGWRQLDNYYAMRDLMDIFYLS